MTLTEFQAEFRQEVAARAEATSDYTQAVFGEMVADALVESGAIHDFNPCAFIHPQDRGMRIDGYSFVEPESTLELFVVDFRVNEDIETLTGRQAENAFKRVEAFVERAARPGLARELEVASPAWGFVRQLEVQAAVINRVEVHLISNAALSSRLTELPTKIIGGREWVYRIWDLAAISKVMTTGEPEEISIDFTELFGRPLPCLAANDDSDGVTSYLTVVPGEWLVAIYARYGGRLLEQNVRTFLQTRTKINKGIRKTILEEPSMFFAYNNGISATAAGAQISVQGQLGLIHNIRRLQIVNGAQTTASLFNVSQKDKAAGLADIRVQMKLSIVEVDKVTEIVPRISQYANSQNKISEADFFSNHPFHVRLENISRHLWAPAREGTQLQTKWFYERARGQYANDQAYLTPSQKKTFLLQVPRNQLVTKTDLAKCIMTFECLPHTVSLGAQKNFAKFAEIIADQWKEDGDSFGENWFRTAIAKVIVFRTIESLVSKATWYTQGYRAQIVTYSIALLIDHLRELGEALDFEKIWRRGAPSSRLCGQILEIGALVNSRIVEASRLNNVSNVTEWCKRKACWEDLLKAVRLRIDGNLPGDLISRGEASRIQRVDRGSQKMIGDVEAQSEVVSKGAEFWQDLMVWVQVRSEFPPSDVRLLKVAASMPRSIPTGSQSRSILDLLKRAHDEGYKSSAWSAE